MNKLLTLNHTQIAINIVIQTDRNLDIFQAAVNISGLIRQCQDSVKTLVSDVKTSVDFAATVLGIGARSLAWGVL